MRNIKGIYVTEVNYLETSRGIAYTAPLFMDNQKVGLIENRGDGGATFIYVDSEYRNEFYKRMNEYLKENNITGAMAEETFAEHIIDVFEYGKVLTDEEKESLLFE
jgi:reverse gyrase